MKLSDIFDQLAYGELSQLALVDTDHILEDEYNRVIHQVNMGLTELHKRFVLKRNTLKVQTLNDVSRYPLVGKHSVSGGSSLPYIMDSVDAPFLDDIIEILEVKDGKGIALALNTAGVPSHSGGQDNMKRVFLPAYNILRFQDDLDPDTYTVEYKANHPRVAKITDPLTFDPSKVDIELPMTHLEALLFYIASRVITPMNGAMNGAPQEGVSYSQRFEQACQQLLFQGLDVEQYQETGRFNQNGFI